MRTRRLFPHNLLIHKTSKAKSKGTAGDNLFGGRLVGDKAMPERKLVMR